VLGVILMIIEGEGGSDGEMGKGWFFRLQKVGGAVK